MINKINLMISNYDLWLLFSRLGPSTVIGFKDPTRGMLYNEINKFRAKAYQNLLSQELIQGPEDNFTIDETLLQLIKSIIFPKKVIIVTSQSEKRSVVVDNYYFSNNSIVNLRTSDLENFQISMSEKDKIFNPLLDSISYLPEEADSSVYIISEQVILDITKFNYDLIQNETFQSLNNSGLNEDSILEFHQLLTQPHKSYSVIMFDNLNQKKFVSLRGFTLLANNTRICVLEPVDGKKSNVKVSWASKTSLSEKINTLLL